MIKLIIFDFDGVIVDSTKFNIFFANKVLQHFSKKKLTKKQEIDAYTLTTKHFYNKYLSDVSKLKAIFYSQLLFTKSLSKFKPMSHLKKLLNSLKKSNYKLAIATNRADETFQILDKLKIRKYFDYILTADNITKPKPNPQVIQKVIKHFNVKPSETIYVGDTHVDSEAAKRAGVISIILINKKDGGDYKVKDLLEIIKVIKEVDKNDK